MKVIVPQQALADNLLCFTTTINGSNGDAGSDLSDDPYVGLNLATHVSDCPERVSYNRALLYDCLRASYLNVDSTNKLQHVAQKSELESANSASSSNISLPLQFLTQVHSTKVVNYTGRENISIEADGLFTQQLAVPLAILTADCLPIALASTVNNESALLHAGWKGLINGIIENALEKFTSPRHTISAWIGPGICQRHFEVGEAVALKFKAYKNCIYPNVEDASLNQESSNDEQKFHINLAKVAEQKLNSLSLVDIQQSDVCTYCRDDLYSFRQATHLGHHDCGRMATVLVRK